MHLSHFWSSYLIKKIGIDWYDTDWILADCNSDCINYYNIRDSNKHNFIITNCVAFFLSRINELIDECEWTFGVQQNWVQVISVSNGAKPFDSM